MCLVGSQEIFQWKYKSKIYESFSTLSYDTIKFGNNNKVKL